MGKFVLFGLEHLIAVCVGFGLIFFILVLASSMNKKRRLNFIRLLALLVLGIKIGELFYRYYYFGEDFIYLLPLHLCSLALILALINSFAQNSAIFQLLYFWGVGAIFAIATPDIREGFRDLVTLSFFVTHFFIVLSVIYTTIFFKFRPSKMGLVLSFIILNILALGIFYLNKQLGTNFLYINALPSTLTFLDVLGPWPYYIISVEAIYLLLSFILYYPFRKKRFKYNVTR